MRPSLYLHVPFCGSRCAYCDFYAVTSGNSGLYLEALNRQLELSRQQLQAPLPSIYIGGGTPSYLPPPERHLLLELIAPWVDADTEVTLECNPEDLSAAFLTELEEGPVTRVSLGVQSLDEEELRRAGRRHDAARARAALTAVARSSLDLSADLILGLPGQSAASWQSSLAGVLAFAPEHLSLYCLELAEHLPLARQLARSPGLAGGEELCATLYLQAHEHLAGAGYQAYEVSNWCRPGRECRHNLAIWDGGEFLGLGPAAHSRLGGRRWSWPASLAEWQGPLLAGRQPEAGLDEPDAAALALERLLLSLRTRRGLPEADPLLRDKSAQLEEFEAAGWARREGGRWLLAPPGWLRLDGILERLAP